MTSKPMIAYPTILAATQGDPEAVQTILRYYAPYILHFSKCSAQLEDGIIYSYVNHEVKQQIEAKLMYGIDTQFDPFSLPQAKPWKSPNRSTFCHTQILCAAMAYIAP